MNEAAQRGKVKSARYLEVAQATSPVRQDISREKILIETALESAQKKIDLEQKLDQDPRVREKYNEILARISTSVAEVREAAPDHPRIEKRPVPRFDRVPKGSDSLANEQIELKIIEMKERREQFIAEVKNQIGTDAELCRIFKESLFEVGGGHYWPAVDPKGG